MGLLFHTIRQYWAGSKRQRQEQQQLWRQERSKEPARPSKVHILLTVMVAAGRAGVHGVSSGVKALKRIICHQKVQVCIGVLCLLMGVMQWELANAIARTERYLIVAPQTWVKSIAAVGGENLKELQADQGGQPVFVGTRPQWADAFFGINRERAGEWNKALHACVDQHVCTEQHKTFQDVWKNWRDVPLSWKQDPLDRLFLKDNQIVTSFHPDFWGSVLSYMALMGLLVVQAWTCSSLCRAWKKWKDSRTQSRALHLIQSWYSFKSIASQILWVGVFDSLVFILCLHMALFFGLGILLLSLIGQIGLALFLEGGRYRMSEERVAQVEALIEKGAPVVERQELIKSVRLSKKSHAQPSTPARIARRL